MNTPILNPTNQAKRKLFAGTLLNVVFYADHLRARLADYLGVVNVGETVRQMLHQYFYAENIPTLSPHDTYLGATAVYTVNQTTLSDQHRGAILTILADSQWNLHDYIHQSIAYPMGRNVANEREYYYTVDNQGRLMVYIPVGFEGEVNAMAGMPEMAVVMACYQTLPEVKRLAFGPALAGMMQVQPSQRLDIAPFIVGQ